MGYRSDVAFEINGPAEVILTGLANIRLATEPEVWSNTKNFSYKLKGDRISLLFNGGHWKWYEDYPVVQFFNGVFQYFEDLDQDDVWGYFLRVGEESDDVEEKHFGDFQWDSVVNLVPASVQISDEGYSNEIPRINTETAAEDNPQNPE